LGISVEIPVIAFVGRLAEPKHPMFAIMVSGHLKALGLEHRLIVIGAGPMRDKCMQLVEERGLLQQVVLLGNRNDVRTLLKEADIFCLFSKWEGLPVSIIEAMYAGLPVVASNVGGISELVEDHKTGYLLDGLDVEKAARLLSVLIDDRKLCQTMGSAGRAVAMKRFSLDGMVSGYRRLYEKL
jgi:glycosyltransferase involved in cell wall biosynthesis